MSMSSRRVSGLLIQVSCLNDGILPVSRDYIEANVRPWQLRKETYMLFC